MAGPYPFPIATDLAAMELGDPAISTPEFVNEKANGADLWKSLSYARLKQAYDIGLSYQGSSFAQINTDDADLSAFRAHGGKLLIYHGLADTAIPPQGSINYYERVAKNMGGIGTVQSFYRTYLVPGMGHSFSNGSANQKAAPPLPTNDQLYRQLTAWVESGVVPNRLDVISHQDRTRSWPLCVYPAKATFRGLNPLSADSYICA